MPSPRLLITVTQSAVEPLGPLSLAVMTALWSGGPQGPTTLHRRVNASLTKPRAFTTVYTTLTRLCDAGLVTHDSRTALYRAAMDRATLTAIISERLIAAASQVTL